MAWPGPVKTVATGGHALQVAPPSPPAPRLAGSRTQHQRSMDFVVSAASCHHRPASIVTGTICSGAGQQRCQRFAGSRVTSPPLIRKQCRLHPFIFHNPRFHSLADLFVSHVCARCMHHCRPPSVVAASSRRNFVAPGTGEAGDGAETAALMACNSRTLVVAASSRGGGTSLPARGDAVAASLKARNSRTLVVVASSRGGAPEEGDGAAALKAGMLVEYRKDTNKHVLVLLAEPNGKSNWFGIDAVRQVWRGPLCPAYEWGSARS